MANLISRDYFNSHYSSVPQSVVDLNRVRNQEKLLTLNQNINYQSSLDHLLNPLIIPQYPVHFNGQAGSENLPNRQNGAKTKLYSDLSIFCEPVGEEPPTALPHFLEDSQESESSQKLNSLLQADQQRTQDSLEDLENPFRSSRPENFLAQISSAREGYDEMLKSQEKVSLPIFLSKGNPALRNIFKWSSQNEAHCQVGSIKYNISVSRRPSFYNYC